MLKYVETSHSSVVMPESDIPESFCCFSVLMVHVSGLLSILTKQFIFL